MSTNEITSLIESLVEHFTTRPGYIGASHIEIRESAFDQVAEAMFDSLEAFLAATPDEMSEIYSIAATVADKVTGQ